MKSLVPILVLSLLCLGLPACSGSDDSASTSTAASKPASTESTPTDPSEFPLLDDHVFDSELRYAADPERKYSFHLAEASASPGKVTIEFVNPQSTPHNVAVEAPNGKTIGETKSVSEAITTTQVVLKPGLYVLYCSLPGHRKAGMVGHLTVE
jgi:plastocyanin